MPPAKNPIRRAAFQIVLLILEHGPCKHLFAANGGKVVFVADTAEKRRVAAEFDGAIVVESCDKVIDVL